MSPFFLRLRETMNIAHNTHQLIELVKLSIIATCGIGSLVDTVEENISTLKVLIICKDDALRRFSQRHKVHIYSLTDDPAVATVCLLACFCTTHTLCHDNSDTICLLPNNHPRLMFSQE